MYFTIGLVAILFSAVSYDREICKQLLGFIMINFIYYFAHFCQLCGFYINLIKKTIIFYFKSPKNDIVITYSSNQGNPTIKITDYKNSLFGLFASSNDTTDTYMSDLTLFGHAQNDYHSFGSKYLMQRVDTTLDKKPKYIESTVKLHAVSIRILENNQKWASYTFTLQDRKKNNMYSYNVENNVLFDRTFIEYWLNLNYSICLRKNQTYDVHFLDQYMDEVTLTEKEYIILTKNNYILKNRDNIINTEPIEL